MNRSFLVREWGAVSFVVTVVIGLLIVPIALYFGNQGPSPVGTTSSSPAAASAARTASPGSPSPTSTPSPVPSPSAT